MKVHMEHNLCCISGILHCFIANRCVFIQNNGRILNSSTDFTLWIDIVRDNEDVITIGFPVVKFRPV